MVDPAELYNTLDDGSGGGLAPRARQEGDAAAALNGLIGFSFKDSSGNVVLPQLDASGRVPVTSDASGTCLYENGELAAGSLSIADVTGAKITLTVTKTYSDIGMIICCLHASLFQIIHTDDEGGGGEVQTVIAEAIVGPGQFSFQGNMDCFILDTTGGTGTITLKIAAKNFRVLSSLRGALQALERD